MGCLRARFISMGFRGLCFFRVGEWYGLMWFQVVRYAMERVGAGDGCWSSSNVTIGLVVWCV